MSLAELEASLERVIGVEVPLRLASAAALDYTAFMASTSIASQYQLPGDLGRDAAHVHSDGRTRANLPVCRTR
jgi:hypothetical protein